MGIVVQAGYQALTLEASEENPSQESPLGRTRKFAYDKVFSVIEKAQVSLRQGLLSY
jgi:hypothetical protein